MKRKHIAVILSQPDSVNQRKLLEGLLEEAFSYDLDVSVFAPFIKQISEYFFEKGEYDIFTLVNFEKFDGILLVPDTIKNKTWLDDIVLRIKQSKKPAVTIDMEIEGIPCVYNDDSVDIERIVDHLIDDHGFDRIDYFSGLEGHPHARIREQGYKNSLAKHGIEFEPERLHYGDFWTYLNEKVADDIINSELEMPQAVACVSNVTAISLVEAFEKRGLKVPEDIVVVGYDSNDAETFISSPVTTMRRDAAKSSRDAVKKLAEMISAEQVREPREPEVYPLIIGKKCGCNVNSDKTEHNNYESVDLRTSFVRGSIYDVVDRFESGYNFMMEKVVAADSVEDFFWGVDWYIHYISGFDSFCMCLRDDWASFDNEVEEFAVRGYSDEMIRIYYKDENLKAVDLDDKFKSRDMHRELFDGSREKPSVFYFSPLHFNDRCFGYTVMQFVDKPVVFNNDYAKLIRNIGNGFEALRRQLKLKYFKDKMEKLSVTDLLTGIYNRNGFNSIAYELYETAKETNQNVMLIYGDLNNLKFVNDNFGHNEGDVCIKVASDAMKSMCLKSEKCYRIGGDEYVVMGIGEYDVSDIEKRIEKAHRHIADFLVKNDKNYEISISIGYEYAPADSVNGIESILHAADKKMFEVKKLSKKYRQ